jgi:hypothetical protein
MAEIKKLFSGDDFEDVITKNQIDVSKHTSSKTLMQDIKKGLIDTALSKSPAKKKTKKNTKKKANLNLGTKELKKKLKSTLNKVKADARKMKSVRGSATTNNGSQQQIASLVQLLNAKLPHTVAENMGLPGLVYRSGRFASSVRVTDVIPTAQGYPSVGYTYQKSPYQVFEMGAGTPPWATPARDPRKVIDASIREIAQELAVGRFYTRRV